MNAGDEQQAATIVPTETLREWVAACDPSEPIDSSDRRYFDLGKGLRGDYEIGLLLDPIKLMPESCQLFSGFEGTGKSTELRELARALEERGYSVLLVDAGDYHDLSRELNVVDLLVVVAGAFGEATGRRLGKDVLTAGYWQRLIDFLKQEVGVSEARLRMAIEDLRFGIREELPFWPRLRHRLNQSLGKLQADTHGFIRGCVERIRRAEPRSRGVVFIMDSLEKVDSPLPGKFCGVMESVLGVLSKQSHYLRLPDCHSIFTVPPYVQLVSAELSRQYDQLTPILPAIRVREPGLTVRRHEPGVNALVELVNRRIPVDQVFGSHQDRLARVIDYSGGHLRMLIYFLRRLVMQANSCGLPPSDQDVRRVVESLRAPARMSIGGAPGALILERVLQEGRIKNTPRGNHPEMARFMNDVHVLCYRNDDECYQVHPLVHDHVVRLAARAKCEQRPS